MGELPDDARLGAIRLRVRDVELERQFYEAAIGLDAASDGDGATVLGIDGGDPLVELVSDPDAPPRPPGTTGLFHLALLTPSRPDLAHALRRVIGSGWNLTGASDHLVSEALYLNDTEGNGIELYRDRPRDQWPRTPNGVQMATLPLDLEDLVAEAGQEIPNVMPAGTTLGHVHLQVDDIDRAAAFWVDAVGFDVIARLGSSALFVSAGGYHHHLGLNTWAGEGAPRPPEGATGMVHFELVLPDAGAVDAVAERVGRVTELERVDAGVLAEDPSGNRVLLRC
jgi:catechol 2,3-dioxygenase